MSHTDKLSDQRYRRTAQCSKYVKLLREKNRTIPTFNDDAISGKEITSEFVTIHGLKKPVLIKDGPRDLNMRMLDPSVTLSDISHILGPHTPIKVIDVGNQEEVESWTFGDYATFFEQRGKEHKILNLISLEISASPLATKIQGPSFVRQIDWIDAFWPSSRRARGDYPRVQKYLLAGMQGAYTDFHLDFGGTSVWYHVLWGQKIFYFIRPTCANLRIFEQWSKDSLQSSQFLPDLLPHGQCFQVHLHKGDTMIIPGGWIHAVYTPEDSLVFGGNFIHVACIGKQLQVYGIEERTRIGKKYRFPYFKQLMWLALTSLLPIARSNGESDSRERFLNDPFYDLFVGLDHPKILEQWIYLVKMCDLWLCGSDISPEEKAMFSAASAEAGSPTNEDVLSSWFGVLRGKIDGSSNGDVKSLRDTLDRLGMVSFNTKEYLLYLVNDANLDIGCEMPSVKTDYENKATRQDISPSSPADPDTDVNARIVKNESAVESNSPDPSTTHNAVSSGSGMRLKFKLGSSKHSEGQSDTTKTAATTRDALLSPDVHGNLTPQKPALVVVVPPHDSESLFGSDDEEERDDVKDEAPEINDKAALGKKTFKFHVKASGEDTTQVEAKTNLAFKVKKIKKIKATEVIQEDTLGKERYGTRGLKLSAKFLENAADFNDDADDLENYDLRAGPHDNGTAHEVGATGDANTTVEDAVTTNTSTSASSQTLAGKKRVRGDDNDFVFDVADAEDAEDYQVSDDAKSEDDDWVGGNDGDEDYDEIVDEEETKQKRRKIGVAPKVSKGPGIAAAPLIATNTVGTRIKIGTLTQTAGNNKNGIKPASLSVRGGAGMTKSGSTVRQQLLKKLGSKYK